MQTDRTLISLADLVHRAVAIVDPDAANPAVSEYLERYEDADEPVRGLLPVINERIAYGADEDPDVITVQQVVLYLAHRLDEVDDTPERILELALKAEDLPDA
jgi:hypothetical protein